MTSVKSRLYRSSYGVRDLTTGSGDGGGGSDRVRNGQDWMTAESVERDADLRTRNMRWSVASVVARENARLTAVSAFARWRGTPESKLHQFALTATFVLADEEDDPTAGAQMHLEFDLLDPASVDHALEVYRQFVIDSTTAALHVEQALARENAAGFWANWEGA